MSNYVYNKWQSEEAKHCIFSLFHPLKAQCLAFLLSHLLTSADIRALDLNFTKCYLISYKFHLFLCEDIFRPMRPFHYDFIQFTTGTFGCDELSMPKQTIIWSNFFQFHSLVNEFSSGGQLAHRRLHFCKRSNERDANTSLIVSFGMISLTIPTASLKNISIATYWGQKWIQNSALSSKISIFKVPKKL